MLPSVTNHRNAPPLKSGPRSQPIPPTLATSSITSTTASSSRSSLFKKNQAKNSNNTEYSNDEPETNSNTSTNLYNHHSVNHQMDAKEQAALQRNVESLTKMSRSNAKLIKKLNQNIQTLKNQLRVSKAETKVAIDDLAQSKSTQNNTNHTNHTNHLTSRIRELTHSLTLSRQNEEKAKEELEKIQSYHKSSMLSGGVSVSATSNDNSKLRQQLQTVSAHSKSLLVRNKQLEEELKEFKSGENELTSIKNRLTMLKNQLIKEKDKNEINMLKINEMSDELSNNQKLLNTAQHRRSIMAKDLSKRTEELFHYKSENEMMKRRMNDSSNILQLYEKQNVEMSQLQQKLNDMNQLLLISNNTNNDTIEKNRLMEENITRLQLIEKECMQKSNDILSLKKTNQSLALAITKYKDAIDELHPQVIECKYLKNENMKLKDEIIRINDLQSSDVMILTNEMKRLREQNGINIENEKFLMTIRMQLDDCLLREQEAKNTRLQLYDEISRLKSIISNLKNDITYHEDALRDNEMKHSLIVRQLSNSKNELSGVLRMNNALEDECDDKKRIISRLKKDLVDVENERDHLQERIIDVENRMTEVETQIKEEKKHEIIRMKTIFNDEMENQKVLLRLEMEKNEKLKEQLNRMRKRSVSAAAKKAGQFEKKLSEALKKTEKELRATVSKLIAAEEASETAFTCMKCMEIMKKPVTCIPCGHSFCESCLSSNVISYDDRGNGGGGSGGGGCPECESNDHAKKTEYYIDNQLLENLCARYVFRKQAISSLKNMSESMTKKIEINGDSGEN
jgi:chromosome segregation ATPase